MYYNSLPRFILNNTLNTTTKSGSLFPSQKSWIFGERIHAGFLRFYSLFSKNMSGSRTVNFERSCQKLTYESMFPLDSVSFLLFIGRGFQKIPQSLKEQSVHVVRVCTQQCECVLAHRIRRGQQIFSLYSKLWDEVALKEMLRKMRQQFSKRGKEFLLGAVGISAYNWEKERISDDEVKSHLNEIQRVHDLRDFTMTCSECKKRMVVDVPLSNIEYCSCISENKKCFSKCMDGWQPFLERDDILVWRKECEQCQGMYVYKVYGSYSEVTAEDFLKVQVDTEFRMAWDNTAINLKVIENDTETNSDIVYWEMAWPRLFSNRDYVYKRRYMIDEERNVIIIISKGTEHPEVPVKAENHRVTDYWSIMVIKAHTSIHKPGMEFSLTYFDNPGVSIPASVTTWVAMNGLPDYQMKLRQAARDYRNYNPISGPYKDDPGPKLLSGPTSDSGGTEATDTPDNEPSTTSNEPSKDQPLPNQELHATNPSSSQEFLKQFHAWQLFI